VPQSTVNHTEDTRKEDGGVGKYIYSCDRHNTFYTIVNPRGLVPFSKKSLWSVPPGGRRS
jgi:hypothetical protein